MEMTSSAEYRIDKMYRYKYEDLEGKIYGPFEGIDMAKWDSRNLFDDDLTIYRISRNKEVFISKLAISTVSRRFEKEYNKQRILRLEGVQVEDLEDDGALKHGWIIKTPAKSFAVYAATETEKREWMLHIERCVSDLLVRGNKTAATAHAAVWVPDGEAAKCMVCGETQFNLVQRRHHCRNCGRVVCGSCSSKTFRIDNVNKKPVRVCDHCFDNLNTPGAEGSATGNRLHHDESSSDSEDEASGAGRSSESRPTFYREDVQQPIE